MKRREFVTLGATTLGMLPLAGFIPSSYVTSGSPAAKPSWLLELIRINDKELPGIYAAQLTEEPAKWKGAILDADGIHNPQQTGNFIARAACALSSPESSFYRSSALLKRMEAAMRYLVSVQHGDGTIDLLSTNFHSTPDTAFSVEKLLPSYKLVKSLSGKEQQVLLDVMKTYLQRAGEALVVGGLHTPNHRWVVSGALSKLHSVWPDARYVKRAEEWLSEHIDLDPDGQYTEKSVGGYSAIIDRVLIGVAKDLNKPELLNFVRKNLNMTMLFIHPNGELVTDASRRQDKGAVRTPDIYYYAYRYFALLDKNGMYAAMCRLIENKYLSKVTETLEAFLEDPFLWQELPGTQPLPVSYAKAFPWSGLVRIRRNDRDATILSDNPRWLTFHKGAAALEGMRLAASFFGKGQFSSPRIEKQGAAWVLSSKLEGVYYQPYPPAGIDPNGNLDNMPRSNRPKSEIQHLETEVRIEETDDGLYVDINMTGTEGVPVTLELIFREGGKFSGVDPHPSRPGTYFLKASAAGSYTLGKDTIHFGPGLMDHKGTQLRGALPSMGLPTVCLTGFTPFKHRIKLS